jgi:hypothetical protein
VGFGGPFVFGIPLGSRVGDVTIQVHRVEPHDKHGVKSILSNEWSGHDPIWVKWKWAYDADAV